MPRLKEEQYQKIVNDYLSGMTQKEVGKKNYIGRDAVGNILRARNIEIREYTGERVSNKKWFWNTNFFNERLPRTAYWAGFMMADGSLSDTGRSYSLIVFLQETDRSHLERFCADIDLPIEAIYSAENRGHKSFGIHLNYVRLPEQMLPWGIVPRKTYNFVEPQVSDELLPHYLRGWADGDGQIYATGEGARFTVSGNTKSLEWYAQALRRLGYSGGIQFRKRNPIYSVMYIGGQTQTSKVINLVCPNGNEIRLERKWKVHYEGKYDLIDTICEHCGNHFGVRKFKSRHPSFGRFCSEKCHNEHQKKPIVDGKTQCVKCKEWKFLNDMSGNPSYCKVCWNNRAREYRAKKKRII